MKNCSLDVLRLPETHNPTKSDEVVLQKFKRQLTQDENGCYEANLTWKDGQSNVENKPEKFSKSQRSSKHKMTSSKLK